MDFNFYPFSLVEEQSDETIKQLDAQGSRYQIDEGKGFVYYVDIEKGVVAALMKDPLKEAAPIADKTLQQFIENNLYPQFNFSIFEKHLSAPIRAKATCAEEDEFDLSVGMKIARERCLAKYYKKLTNAFVDLNNLVDPILSYIEDQCVFYAEKFQNYSK